MPPRRERQGRHRHSALPESAGGLRHSEDSCRWHERQNTPTGSGEPSTSLPTRRCPRSRSRAAPVGTIVDERIDLSGTAIGENEEAPRTPPTARGASPEGRAVPSTSLLRPPSVAASSSFSNRLQPHKGAGI